MKNKEVLTQQIFELTQYNELPLVLCISGRPIKIDCNDTEDLQVIAIDYETGEVIGIMDEDGYFEEVDLQWLDEPYDKM